MQSLFEEREVTYCPPAVGRDTQREIDEILERIKEGEAEDEEVKGQIAELRKKLKGEKQKNTIKIVFRAPSGASTVIRDSYLFSVQQERISFLEEHWKADGEPDDKTPEDYDLNNFELMQINMCSVVPALLGCVVPEKCVRFKPPNIVQEWLEKLPDEVLQECLDTVWLLAPHWQPMSMEDIEGEAKNE